MIEDITQDPEYIKGYEEGMRRYEVVHSPWSKGYNAGFDALKKASKTVESKAIPSDSKQDKQPKHSPETVNPFIVEYQQDILKATQLGIEPPRNPWDHGRMERIASWRIINECIKDDASKIKVYEEVKAQFKEYEEYLRSQGVPEPKSSKSESTTITAATESPQLEKAMNLLRESLDFCQRTSESITALDERLKKLEKYTQE